MKKALTGILSLAFVVCSGAGIAACTENNSRRGTIINFATYESWDEGFSYLSIMDGFGRVTKSDEQAHGGKYSAKVQPLGSHTDSATKPFFYYPMKIEGDGGFDYSDFAMLNSVSFSVYNAEPEALSFEFCIIASISDIEGADCKAVQTVTADSGKWTDVTYRPDYDALQNMCDVSNIAGIAFRFENCNSADIASAPVLYFDDVQLSLSDTPNVIIQESEPARGEMQSFDAASSLVYVNMDSGVDFAETWLPAGDAKLPAGVKGGVEFAITEADIGTWPRLKFDSRTPQADLEKADYFSMLLYFDVPNENVSTVEIRMVPDTGDVYTEYVKPNEWVELRIETDILINNWSTVIGVQSRGLFWVQNGLQGSCFNDIKAIRVADIKGVFREIRIPDLADGKAGEAYTIPAATLEIDGQAVTASSWSYEVAYSDAALYEEKYGKIEVTDGAFVPEVGGTYVVTYIAEYDGKTYFADGEVFIARNEPETGEIELFADPASVDNVSMESGSEYIGKYLWAGDEKLPEGAKGGVEFAIPDAASGTWPRFRVNSRIEGSVIDQFRTVSFDLYLDAPTYDGKVLVKLFPDVSESDYYAETNKWVTISVSAQLFSEYVRRVGLDGTGLFWVQNGDTQTCMNAIDTIRITNIRAEGEKFVRPDVKADEIEWFGDEGSLDNISVSAGQPVDWTEKLPGQRNGGAALVTVDTAQDLWLDITVKARQSTETYRALQAEGYNVVTMEVYLKKAADTTSRVAQMNYWAGQNGASQGSVAIGSWVKLTFDLENYLTLLEGSSDGGVKLLWIASFGNKKVSEIYIRNVQVEKVADAVSFADGTDGFFLLDSPENVPSYAYVAAGDESIPAGAAGGAVKMSFAAGAESWPNLKFGADKSLLSRYAKISLRIYIKAAEGTDKVTLNLLPDGGVNGTAEVATNQWVTVEISVADILAEYEWSVFDGITYTNLFWFTNAGGNTVSEFWVSGMTLVK